MPSELGDFLTGRRARVTPEAAGLPAAGPRRVPGLRREEVAVLAGTSADYYTRLEQGRERKPSAQVVEALAAALRLDDDERLHLFRLAGLALRPVTAAVDRADPSLRGLMDRWPENPALVLNRAYDVLASNVLADTLFGGWSPSHNLAEIVFGDAHARSLYRDWPEIARATCAGLRMSHGEHPGDPRLAEVLRRLLGRSEEFCALWARHDAQGKSLARKRLYHPQVGDLTVTVQTFDVRHAPGQQLVVYDAEPGSPASEALRLLGTLAATERSTTG
ncbi:helix-turn-helix transcriptional regulator [Prauserella alba]|uniref:Helix-turn-helix transcriptional regulator n=1 Tax=Prauserella alba TaxID=176898 RepID=A0ABP4FZY9_9PSEU|nr:helix-turn-helix transcriptional regulator [Prauserella alba]MCP2183553.1 Helix-turn-helix domain-containing protein [Prauserella alba]